MPRDFEHNPEDDDHDHSQRRTNIAQFNDKLTLALLRATQGTFHQCAQLVQLQNNTARRQSDSFGYSARPLRLSLQQLQLKTKHQKYPNVQMDIYSTQVTVSKKENQKPVQEGLLT